MTCIRPVRSLAEPEERSAGRVRETSSAQAHHDWCVQALRSGSARELAVREPPVWAAREPRPSMYSASLPMAPSPSPGLCAGPICGGCSRRCSGSPRRAGSRKSPGACRSHSSRKSLRERVPHPDRPRQGRVQPRLVQLVEHVAVAISGWRAEYGRRRPYPARPPTARTMGTVPYFIAIIWLSPHGSNGWAPPPCLPGVDQVRQPSSKPISRWQSGLSFRWCLRCQK